MKNVLVFGGHGFIGSHTVEKLRNHGIKVTIFDYKSQNFNGKHGNNFLGNILDIESVIESVGLHDGIIHLAGLLGTQETINQPLSIVETNVKGSLNIFEACKIHKKKAVILSVGNYWMNNPYAISKSTAERFALMYNKEFSTKIAVVRGYNIYGPRQKTQPDIETSPGNLPWTESYFKRWASVFTSVRSFKATTLMFDFWIRFLKLNLPIRPKPLIATLIVDIDQRFLMCPQI